MPEHNFRSLDDLAGQMATLESTLSDKDHIAPTAKVLTRLTSAILYLAAELKDAKARLPTQHLSAGRADLNIHTE